MFIATVVVSLVFAAVLSVSARLKLSRGEAVVAAYARVGVPAHRLSALAVLLVAGAAGLVIGLWWAPLGIAAAACLTCYFLLAIGAHVRHRDLAHVNPPIALAAFAITTLVLRIVTT